MEAGDGLHAAQELVQLEMLDMNDCYVTKAPTSLDPLLLLLVDLPNVRYIVRPGRQWQRGIPAAVELARPQNVMRARQGLEITVQPWGVSRLARNTPRADMLNKQTHQTTLQMCAAPIFAAHHTTQVQILAAVPGLCMWHA